MGYGETEREKGKGENEKRPDCPLASCATIWRSSTGLISNAVDSREGTVSLLFLVTYYMVPVICLPVTFTLFSSLKTCI